MYCPDCGNYVDSHFCPNCGCDLRNAASQDKPSTSIPQERKRCIYLGDTKISQHQFEEIQQQMQAGEKLEAIKRIRMWTPLSLADALHIADNFDSIDFNRPQELIHVNKSNRNTANHSKQEKAQNAVKAVGKGVGLAAFAAGALGFRVISNLTKRYSNKRR